MDDYLAFAKDLARRGGALITDNFERNVTIEIKSDHSPVTEVDKAINDLVITAIKQNYPDHGVLGEEIDHGTGTEELQWLCDPLDGTKAFIMGVPVNTFVLGLMQRRTLLLSVVYHPFSDRLYHAIKGQGAYCNEQKIGVNKQTLEDGGFVTLGEYSYGFVEPLRAAGAQVDFIPGAAYRAMLLASGRLSGIMQLPINTDFHDVGPASLIVEEAGGRASDLQGGSLNLNHPPTNGIILSNGAAHSELLKVVQATP